MKNELTIFEGIELDVLTKEDVKIEFNGECLFNGKQITEILGYSNGNRDIDRHCDEDCIELITKDKLNTVLVSSLELGQRGTKFINEDGVMDLIYNSKLPKAKEFKKKVREIVKSVQATGKYDSIEEKLKTIEDETEKNLKLTIYQYENIVKMNPTDILSAMMLNNKKNELNTYLQSKEITEIKGQLEETKTKLDNICIIGDRKQFSNEVNSVARATGKEQSDFIKDNIEYIRKHHEDIFIYNMYAPKALGGFLSFESQCTIFSLDKNIFSKLIEHNLYEMRERLSDEEQTKFYDLFYENINKLPNLKFISILTCTKYAAPKTYKFIKERYKEKLSTFNGYDLLHYYEYQINDNFDDFFSKYKPQFLDALLDSDNSAISNFYKELDCRQRSAIIKYCYEGLKEKDLFNKLLRSSNIDTIISIYKNHPDILNNISIDTIATLTNPYDFTENFDEKTFRKIINHYPLESIEFLTKYNRSWFGITKENIAMKFIEEKYRKNIVCDGNFLDVDMSHTIYSSNYLKNLKEFSKIKIDINDERYILHLKIFIKHLLKNEIIDIPTKEEFSELNYFFYKIIKGKTLSIIPTLSSINDIALMNRLHTKEFNPDSFSLEQIKRYNVKQHKELYFSYTSSIKENEFMNFRVKEYKLLTLKLMLMLGYKGAKYVLDIDDSIETLEHLVGNVDVSNVKMDENSNPVLINRFMNMMFNDKDNPRIKEMLADKTSKLYTFFPRIFNEWEIMSLSHKTDKLSSIFNFLESEDIHLPVKYYRLKQEIKHVGIKNSILTDAMSLHDKMLKRIGSTIPRVKGMVNDYEYEVLRFDDMLGISVGNRTNCCFTIRGRAYSCLKHALTSDNGRILVVKKDGKLIAHSWLWRNGDLLCLDNIEVNKNVSDYNFLDVYKDYIIKTISVSQEFEGKECIKNVTVGVSSFTRNNTEALANSIVLDISKTQLTTPLEHVTYSDAHNTQYVLFGNANHKSYSPSYLYKDERLNYHEYTKGMEIEKSSKLELENNLNYLRYLQHESEGTTDKFELINIDNIDSLYINKDYYIYIKNNKIYSYCLDYDYRAKDEYTTLLNNTIKTSNRK